MTLLALLREHRGPLAADFRRFYGLSLANIRHEGIPLTEVADLAANVLLYEGAVYRTVNEHWWRTAELDLLREIEHGGRVLAWQQTKDGSKGRNAPERIKLPWDSKPEGGFQGDVMDWDEAAERFGWSEAMSKYFD